MERRNQAAMHARGAAFIPFLFYGVTLLGYSIYSVSTSGEFGVPFIIFVVGQIIFFAGLVVQRGKGES